jgi:hypothetical protein
MDGGGMIDHSHAQQRPVLHQTTHRSLSLKTNRSGLIVGVPVPVNLFSAARKRRKPLLVHPSEFWK